MIVTTNSKNFEKQMKNLIDYSVGFLDGAKKGKPIFLKNLGQGIIKSLYKYIDLEARVNPQSMHHVYEWYKVGSPAARLYDINYTVSNLGLSITSTFRQSKTVSRGSKVPFYDKAKIMENGVPVTIKPKKAMALRFEVDGEEVFTKNEININQPGGPDVQGSFQRVFDEFMLKYFKQSFISASGLYSYIKKPVLYKKNLKSGSKLGKAKGLETGYRWITNAKIEVE